MNFEHWVGKMSLNLFPLDFLEEECSFLSSLKLQKEKQNFCF